MKTKTTSFLFVIVSMAIAFAQTHVPFTVQFRREVMKQAATNSTPAALQEKFSLSTTNGATKAATEQITACTNRAQIGIIERKFTTEEIGTARNQVFARPGFEQWKSNIISRVQSQ